MILLGLGVQDDGGTGLLWGHGLWGNLLELGQKLGVLVKTEFLGVD